MMEIQAKEIQVVDIDSLVLNPKNNNKHPKEQIERLAKLIKYQGFRNPLVVSKRTGFVLAGHGRIDAARLAGLKEVPVMYQDFENEAQEYAYLTSDNAIASWSELDLSAVNTEMLDLGPDFDIDLLGIKDFVIDINEANLPSLEDVDNPEIGQLAFMVTENQRLVINDAVSNAIKNEELDLYDNTNKNAAAIYLICQRYMSERD